MREYYFSRWKGEKKFSENEKKVGKLKGWDRQNVFLIGLKMFFFLVCQPRIHRAKCCKSWTVCEQVWCSNFYFIFVASTSFLIESTRIFSVEIFLDLTKICSEGKVSFGPKSKNWRDTRAVKHETITSKWLLVLKSKNSSILYHLAQFSAKIFWTNRITI